MYVTPAPDVSNWSHNTLEQARIQARLIELGVEIRVARNLARIEADEAVLSCVYSGSEDRIAAATIVIVTSRLPVDDLYHELRADSASLKDAGIRSVTRIGDCRAPATIAEAVYSGHRYAREVDTTFDPDVAPFRREVVGLSDDWPASAGS